MNELDFLLKRPGQTVAGINTVLSPAMQNALMDAQRIEQAPQAANPAQAQASMSEPKSPLTMQSFSFSGPTPQRAELVKNLSDAYEAEKAKRQEYITRLQEQVDAEKSRGRELDWSPMIAYVDSVSGSNLMKGYQRPQNQQERQAQIQQMEQFLAAQQGKVSETEVDRLKAMINADDQRTAMRMAEMSDRNARFAERESRQMEDTIRKDVAAVNENFKADMRDTDALSNVINQPSPSIIEVQAVLSNFARRIGGDKGALSDGDVARAMPGTAINSIEKFKAWVGQRGTLDPQVRAAMQRLTQFARENTIKYQRERLGEKRMMYASGGKYQPLMAPGMPGDSIFGVAEKAAQSQANSSQVASNPIRDEILKRLQQKGK